MKLGIRVDANSTIGTGHLMRCITIAKAAKNLGADIIFITADEEPASLLIQNDFEFLCTNKSYKEFDFDIETVITILVSKNIEVMLVDSYFVTENFINSIKDYVKVVYIDDLYLRLPPVNLLINYNLYSDKYKYLNNANKLLLGARYTPLREEFTKIKSKKVRNEIMDVLITTGGTDTYNFCIDFISRNDIPSEYNYNIVVGKYFQSIEKLIEISKKKKNVSLLFNVQNMSEVMLNNDIAISAGGTTLYELAVCGITGVCFSLADNQLEGVKAFDEKGLLLYAGDIRVDKSSCIYKVIFNLKKLKDYIIRKEMSEKMLKTVSANGAERIAIEILSL